MKFTLTEAEIHAAISNYVKDFVKGEVNNIELKATRGSDGTTAEVDLSLPGDKVQPAAPIARSPEPIKQEVVEEAKPEPVAAPVDEPVEEVTEAEAKPVGRSLFNITKD